MIQKKMSFKLSNLIPLVLVVLLATIYLFPIILMLATAVKTNDQAFNTSLGLWPETFHLENFRTVFEIMPFGRYAFNSLYISFMSVLGITLSCPMVAYSLSKIKWAGRDTVFSFTTACMMIPYTVTMVPLYRMWSRAGLVGTFWPLILPTFFGAPFYIIILRQFMLTIPDELLEAAEIDGCSRWGIYVRLVFPLAKPGIATIAIFAFMNAFSDFMGPLLYANSKDHYTLSIGLHAFLNEHTVNWTGLMAAATVFMVPIMVVFLFCQKNIIDGISTSGLKG